MQLPAIPARFRLPLYLIGSALLWRGALFAVIFATRVVIPERAFRKDVVAFPESRFWDSFARWDSIWYWKVATKGYYLEQGQSDIAFFPGFPFLTRALAHLTGDVWSAGLIIVNLSLLGSLFFLYGIARHYFDDADARRAPLWVLMFPASIFLSSFYTEAPFLLAVSAAFYFYERDQLLLAGVCGCLAALTRLTGILLLPAFLFGLLHRNHYRFRDVFPKGLALLLIPVGLLGVMYINHEVAGDPLAFVKAQAAWNRHAMFPLVTMVEDVQRFATNQGVQFTFDYVAVMVLFAVVAASLHKLDLAHSIFALGSVLVPLCSGRVTAIERYATSVVAVYLMLTYATRNPQVERFVIYLSSIFLALHAVFFSSWYFAG